MIMMLRHVIKVSDTVKGACERINTKDGSTSNKKKAVMKMWLQIQEPIKTKDELEKEDL